MSHLPEVLSPNSWHPEERGRLLNSLFHSCTSCVAAGSSEEAFICLERMSQIASPVGDMIHRLAAYFTKALADRMLKGWPGIYKAFNSTQTSVTFETNLVQKLFYERCPFLKVAYVVTNQAIIEAMEGEKLVHVIDLNSFEPAQWVDLMHTLRARTEGPPHLRITGIHDQEDVLKHMDIRLREEANKLRLSFQFSPLVKKLEDLDMESLGIKAGEAVAVSSVLQLHSLLASDEMPRFSNLTIQTINSSNLPRIQMQKKHRLSLGQSIEEESMVQTHSQRTNSLLSPPSLAASPNMGSFLSTILRVSPKVMVVTEQESDHNATSLEERVKEALNYYRSIFDCLETTLSKAPVERQTLEMMLFGEEIKDIIACEGSERKQRHEKLEKWIPRMELAGFRKVSMSDQGKLLASKLLRGYGFDGYKVKDENGCLVTCWNNKPLYSVSSWKCRGLRH